MLPDSNFHRLKCDSALECLMFSFISARCGPPSKQNLIFKRSSGHLSVEVDWGDERNYIKTFSVKYRVFNTAMWKEVSNN